MGKILLMLCCIAFSTACCMTGEKDESVVDTPSAGVVCILYRSGAAGTAQPADSLAAIALKLLESSTDQALLAVNRELVASLKEQEIALEVIYPDTLTVAGPTGVKHRIDRILIPLSGDYGPADDLSSALLLFGNGSYGSGPLMNNQARSELARLKELLGV